MEKPLWRACFFLNSLYATAFITEGRYSAVIDILQFRRSYQILLLNLMIYLFFAPPPLRQGTLVVYLEMYGFHPFPFGEINISNFIAACSSTFICKVLSLYDQCPDVWTSLQTAPNPFREASVWIIICGFNREKLRSLQYLKFSICQVNSVLNLVFNVITDW